MHSCLLQSQRLTLDLLADVATMQEYQPVSRPEPPPQITPIPTPPASVMPFIHLPPGNHRIIQNTLFTLGNVDTVVYDRKVEEPKPIPKPKPKPKPKAKNNAKTTK